MTGAHPGKYSLCSAGMWAVLAAQFCSALADNAVLIVAIAIVKDRDLAQYVPLLQLAFVMPFILLAPFVGEVADSFSKRNVMFWANSIKLAGTALMAWGSDPFVAYGLVGIGATVYSPAKYGILSQMVDPEKLVRANGMLEASTIAAILLGVLLGGWLADHSPTLAFGGVIAAYATAAVANVAIPKLAAEHSKGEFAPRTLSLRFFGSVRLLFGDRDARFSLLGTSIFWGSGTTLRLLLFAWVPVALGMNDNQTPANLMGIVSVGIVFGAATAGAWISLENANRALVGGLLLGPAILAMAAIHDMPSAAALMIAIGLCGGLFIVPLNALLQDRGHRSVGSGNALAVQNFFENSAMLLFVGGYSLASAAGASVRLTATVFGIILLAAVAGIATSRFTRSGERTVGGRMRGRDKPSQPKRKAPG